MSQQTNTQKVNYNALTSNIDYGDEVYVIGHKSPDTDTVCSALAYANLKCQLGINCKAAVAGNMNNETKYVLDKFDVCCPEVLTDASDKNIILVDHSTYTQSIDGMKDANIVEILDHHNLGDVKSSDPLQINTNPIGATATIVYTCYLENNVPIDKRSAGLMLSAILSDTANLTLEITTQQDKDAVAKLAKIAEVNDVDAYFKVLEEKLSDYSGMNDNDIFVMDYKEYDMSGTKIGIACVNADGQAATEDMCKRMQASMQNLYSQKGMKHLYCMVRDTSGDYTILLSYGDGSKQIADKAFSGENQFGGKKITPAASRKKNVVPNLEKTYGNK